MSVTVEFIYAVLGLIYLMYMLVNMMLMKLTCQTMERVLYHTIKRTIQSSLKRVFVIRKGRFLNNVYSRQKEIEHIRFYIKYTTHNHTHIFCLAATSLLIYSQYLIIAIITHHYLITLLLGGDCTLLSDLTQLKIHQVITSTLLTIDQI